MVSYYNEIKLEISSKRKFGKFTNMWKLDNISLNNQWGKKENARKIFADSIVCDQNGDAQLGKTGIFSARNCIDSPNPEMTGGSGL